MSKNKRYPNWFLWQYEYFPKTLIVATLIFAAFVFVLYITEKRQSGIEEQPSYAPPRSYATPNLEDDSAENVTPDELRERRTVYIPVYSHIYFQGVRPIRWSQR